MTTCPGLISKSEIRLDVYVYRGALLALAVSRPTGPDCFVLTEPGELLRQVRA